MVGPTFETNEYVNQATQTLLVFRLDDQSYALAIENVVQIIPMLRLTPVPQVERLIEGVANIHGSVVPVISARRHLGLSELKAGMYTPIVLTRVGERTMGLIVDEVTDVINVPADHVVSPDAILPDGIENSPVMQAVVYLQDRSILVLEPRYLLRPTQARSLSRALKTVAVVPAVQGEEEEAYDAPAPVPVRPAGPTNGNTAHIPGNGQAQAAQKPLPTVQIPVTPRVPEILPASAPIIENLAAVQNAIQAHQPPAAVQKPSDDPVVEEKNAASIPLAELSKEPESAVQLPEAAQPPAPVEQIAAIEPATAPTETADGPTQHVKQIDTEPAADKTAPIKKNGQKPNQKKSNQPGSKSDRRSGSRKRNSPDV